jgi:tungstate transport system substrate-binding protein
MKRILVSILFLMLLAAPAFAESIICASTTSTQNSGLFDYILPMFEKETGIEVKVVAQGTGAALESGKRGDADVVFVHAKSLELQMVEEGYFINRHDVMYNDFVIIGPAKDPAGVSKAGSAIKAFQMIYEAKAPFVSRGDNSGTHKKELSLWNEAGLTPNWDNYLSVGQGMAKTQRIANEKRAYTLTDRGTWLSKKDELDLNVLFEGDPALFNQYGVMAVSKKMHPQVKYDEAMKFIRWLVSAGGQEAIASYRVNGEQLFYPNADR